MTNLIILVYCISFMLVCGGIGILLMIVYDLAEAWVEELIKKWRNNK